VLARRGLRLDALPRRLVPADVRAVTAALLKDIRAALLDAVVPGKAAGMQAYMKSTMPYHGVPSGPMRAAVRAVLEEHDVESFESWRDDVLALWRGATHREERYAALALCGDRRAKAFHTMDALPMYEELIVTGAWWDYVDDIASHRLGAILRNEPKPMRAAMLKWSRDENMWKRRSSIICQLTFKQDTDLKLLYACIEPSLDSKEFFLRKAIGWSLRQYAWTDPKEVKRWVSANEERLSGLSRREALKNI
jgi:3-methyladenine DNA glycosylase AlkD